MRLALGALALADHDQPEPQPATHDVILVTGYRLDIQTQTEIAPDHAPVLGPDAAGLVARLPAAALMDNGAISGQVQYRDL